MELHNSQVRRIALIGMPASGKTSVGAVLAELEGLPFVDLDEAIAIDAGRSIPDIFADEGEAGFRVRERAALVRIAEGGPVVLATGGGCIELPEKGGSGNSGRAFGWRFQAFARGGCGGQDTVPL